MTIVQQMKGHSLAIISICIALLALSYNTWRDETTERNRTYRAAAFEILKNLDQLQISINYIHYQPENLMVNGFTAWGYVALIGDLSHLLPKPVPERVQQLLIVWKNEEAKIKTDESAFSRVTQEIDASRDAVLAVIDHLR